MHSSVDTDFAPDGMGGSMDWLGTAVVSLTTVGTHDQRIENLVDHSTVGSAPQSWLAFCNGDHRAACLHHDMAVEVRDVVGLRASGNCRHADVRYEDRRRKCRFLRSALAELVEGELGPESSIEGHLLARC